MKFPNGVKRRREREYVMSLSQSSSSLSFELRVLTSLVFSPYLGLVGGWSQLVWVGRRRRLGFLFFSCILFLFLFLFLFLTHYDIIVYLETGMQHHAIFADIEM